mmetsp:Transcript_10010/g.7531  ORF Transcript_10010/g.7531 Transcript_10010/m.7531 type:complete len:104 (+) Transcript_10010:765-1076(+)
MRSKELDPDYRFLADPDLARYRISRELVEEVRSSMGKTPFEMKKELAVRHSMEIEDVQTMFVHSWSLELFEKIVMNWSISPKVAFNWMYSIIYGNVVKKELVF